MIHACDNDLCQYNEYQYELNSQESSFYVMDENFKKTLVRRYHYKSKAGKSLFLCEVCHNACSKVNG